MEIEQTHLKDLSIIHLEDFKDSRGSFYEAFNFNKLSELGHTFRLDQVNVSMSREMGTVRGMHWQEVPFGQIKMVRCIQGEILDVVVDIRPESPTYLKYKSIWMKGNDLQLVYVPHGFAHGWQAIKDFSQIEYFVSGNWEKSAERGIQPEDPAVGIIWPKPVVNVHPRDASWPLLKR